MTSMLTNGTAIVALQTLRTISSDLHMAQRTVSSGLRVAAAADNAAYWSISTTMRSDGMAISAVADSLGLGAAKVDTAYAGMESAIEVVKEIKAKLVTATEEGVDKAKVQEEITQLQDQLLSIAQAASFYGENWLVGESTLGAATPGADPDKTVVSGFVRSADGVSVKTTKYALDNTETGNTLFGSIDANGDPDTSGILGTETGSTSGVTMSVFTLDITQFVSPDDLSADMADALTLVETALKSMTSAAAELGSISMRIELQEDFVNKLSDSIESGIGRLVDADMNEESTRLKALQTQQQLGIQSLSIANSSAEGILSLFR